MTHFVGGTGGSGAGGEGAADGRGGEFVGGSLLSPRYPSSSSLLQVYYANRRSSGQAMTKDDN